MNPGRAGARGGRLTGPMAITLILATLPFWIEQVGLGQDQGGEEGAKP